MSFNKRTVLIFTILLLALLGGYAVLVRKQIDLVKNPSRLKVEEGKSTFEGVEKQFKDMGLLLVPSAKIIEASSYNLNDAGEKSVMQKLVFFTSAQSDAIKTLYEKRILNLGYKQYREQSLGNVSQITATNGTSSITILISSANSARKVTINLEQDIL